VCPGELKADINQTLEAFEHILLLYKSGLHLDNLPPSIIRGRTWWNEGCFLETTVGPVVGPVLFGENAWFFFLPFFNSI